MKSGFDPVESYYQQRLLEQAPSMLAYWDVDLRCRYANRAYERWFGVDSVKLVGTSLRDLLGAELFALNESHILEALQGEAQIFERAVRGPDGTVRLGLASYLPDFVDGVVVGLMVQVTDVTHLKQIEVELQGKIAALLTSQAEAQALRRSEEQLRPLFMEAFDGIFIAGRDGRFTDVNDAACVLIGYSREEILCKSISDLIPLTEAEPVHGALRQMKEGGVLVAEWTLQRKDQSLIPVEVSIKFMSDDRWTAFVRNIAAHKHALEAERALNEELERRVVLRTEQLHRLSADLEAAEDHERRQIARDLHDDLCPTLAAARIRLAALCDHRSGAVRKIANDVDGLMALASHATRSLAEQLAPPILYELGLQPGLEWLAEEIKRGFSLEVSVQGDNQARPLSQVARSILYRATRELLINVAKHARAPSAQVKIWRNGDRVSISVSDVGVGFDPIKISATTNHGLGLDSVRERLSFIGGRAEIRSLLGVGTVALLEAPISTDESDLLERGT